MDTYTMRLREFKILVAEGQYEEALMLVKNPLESTNMWAEATFNGVAWTELFNRGLIPVLKEKTEEKAKRECKEPGWCLYRELLSDFLKLPEEGGPHEGFAMLPEVAGASLQSQG